MNKRMKMYQIKSKVFSITISTFLILGLTISSCSKNEVETANLNNVSFVKNVLSHNDSFVENRDGQDVANHQIPNSTELLEIAEYLEVSEDSDIWMSQFVEIYGYPVWSEAIKSNVTDSSYTVTLPLIKENKVIGVMRYIYHPECIHAYFRGYNDILNIPSLEYSPEELGSAQTLAINYIYFEYVIEGRYNVELEAWIREIENNFDDGNMASLRAETFCWVVIDGYEFVYQDGASMWDDDVAEYVAITHIECIIIGGPNTPNYPNGVVVDPDIVINPDDTSSGKTEDEKKKEKEEAVEDCLQRMSPAARAAFNQAFSSIESELGNKVCFEIDKNDLMYFMSKEGFLDCVNPDVDAVTSHIRGMFEDQASEFDQAVADIRNSDISDICDSDLTADDIANNALTAMQESGDCGVDGLQDAIDGISKIRVSAALATDCPAANCIIKNIQSSSSSLSTSLMQALLKPCQGTTKVNLNFIGGSFTGNSDPNDDSAVAKAEYVDSKQNEVVISINTDLCKTASKTDIFETLQHELIHADIYRRLIENYGFDPSNLSNLSYADAMDLLVYFEYGESASMEQHELMIKYYVDDMVKSLIQMNGGHGTYSDFVGLVLNGFPPSLLIKAGYSISTVKAQVKHSISYVNTKGNIINTTLLGC